MKIIFFAVFLFSSFTCIAQFNIAGAVFYDANYDYQLEMQERTLKQKNIRISQLGSSLVYNLQTDDYGYYSIDVEPGDYIITYNDTYDTANYSLADPVFIYYVSTTYENGDLAFQPKRPATFAGAYLYNNLYTDLPREGSTREFTLRYAFNDFMIASMPVKVTVDFNPMATLISSSIPPALTSPGHAEWNFANLAVSDDYLFSNEADSIHCTFSFPPAGDTISGFKIKPDLIPGIVTYSVDRSNVEEIYLAMAPLPPAAIGSTSGVKWMYPFKRGHNSSFYVPDYGHCIDTAFAGDGYFIAGAREVYDSTTGYVGNVYIAKLNKDGLPLWEKNYADTELGFRAFDAMGIRSLNDGGCIVYGTAYDSAHEFNGVAGVFKTDSNGNILWRYKYDSYYNVYVQDLVKTADNGFMMTGFKSRMVAIDNNQSDSTSTGDLMVMKISADGSLMWEKQYGGSREEGAFKMMALSNGTFLILAATSSIDGDVRGAHQHGYYLENYILDTIFKIEGWILNIDANGNMLWNKCYGGTDDGYFTDAAESGGGILLSGFTYSKDGDLPYYPETGVPLWLLHISNTGSINWSKLHKFYPGYKDSLYLTSPTTNEYGPWLSQMGAAKDGNFTLAGIAVDRYGPVKATHGGTDFCFMKIDPAGNIIWQKAVGGTGDEYFSNSITDKKNDIVFVGDSYSTDDDLYGRNTYSGYGELILGKIGITNTIKGQVFVDNNNNGIKDPGEHTYSNGRVQSAKIADTVTGYIFNGQYLNNVDTGNYVSSYIPSNNYYTVLPAAHNTSFTTLDQADSVNFALKPKPNINDLEIELLPLSIARPGFESSYRIITKNTGTTTINNTLISLKKDSRQSFVSASRPATGIIGDSLWWGPVTLHSFDIDTLDVVMQNAAPVILNNGDTISLEAVANPVINDSSATNNLMKVKQLVLGSFDPNDKTEIHGGQLTPLAYSNGEYLQYVVRFQNTGTDTAFFITIKDTLDTKLNPATLESVAASHPYDFKLDKDIATWDFKFIKLADSTTNEAQSHGYIAFKIKPKTGLALGDVFSNKAAIYFDYNLPVITNEEKTAISDGSGICPGGTIKYTASIAGTSYQWQVNTGAGYTNISNSALYAGANTAELQITAAPSVMYGYKYRCLVNGNTYSAESQLKFVMTWTGAAGTDWQTAANWNCGTVPDANTDVLIKPGVVNYPVVNNAVSCRSIRASKATAILVKLGVQLNVTGR